MCPICDRLILSYSVLLGLIRFGFATAPEQPIVLAASIEYFPLSGGGGRRFESSLPDQQAWRKQRTGRLGRSVGGFRGVARAYPAAAFGCGKRVDAG